MTLTDQHIRALTFLACDTRPHGARQWRADEVYAEIAKVRDRNLGAVICAVTRAAMDRGAERPAVISSAGSHWSDTMLPTFKPQPVDRDATAKARAASVDTGSERGRELVAGVRAEVAVTSGPPVHRTLAEMAEAEPELHARLERLRAACPGLEFMAMRETESEPEEAAL